MARGKDNTASQRIYIRVTPEEKELIKKYANIDKLSTTDYLKKLALKEAIDYSEQSGSSSILVNYADFASIIFLNS